MRTAFAEITAEFMPPPRLVPRQTANKNREQSWQVPSVAAGSPKKRYAGRCSGGCQIESTARLSLVDKPSDTVLHLVRVASLFKRQATYRA